MQDTTRDEQWTTALAVTALQGDEITAAGLDEQTGSGSERTARDVLKTMSQNGILTEKNDGRRTLYRISEGYDPS